MGFNTEVDEAVVDAELDDGVVAPAAALRASSSASSGPSSGMVG